jgi:hypothetical protein
MAVHSLKPVPRPTLILPDPTSDDALGTARIVAREIALATPALSS